MLVHILYGKNKQNQTYEMLDIVDCRETAQIVINNSEYENYMKMYSCFVLISYQVRDALRSL